ncbi:DUF6090 family protein [Ichthyenterobacterium sp. W332]|uniref:DUF6090 family protein n=1 Tax=Microcosmobacter mediterraneus TaxID=3075607 RepID=A0ABU2YGE3_9FLAO|nr:DUF6090 family protein [Ichthyenterobacterium sp. W332]MDT0557221.1 DUF6090 family protein [Ichthyenterobacterium sp. W332]
MIKFFRKIRRNLLIESKTGKYFKYAIGEIILVVIGILIALQINNWNQQRKDKNQEQFILERLKNDLASDIELISYQMEKSETFRKQYVFCIEVLLNEREATREEFMDNFSSITTILYYKPNRTTFDNIVSSGQMDLLQNKDLTNNIIKYYNEGSDIGWDTALINYTRNFYGPYIMQFDHKPNIPNTSHRGQVSQPFTQVDIAKSRIKPKTIDDYKNDLFILNMLRSKINTMEGQMFEYKKLELSMQELFQQLEFEIKE